jgi:hypothetical protein
MLAVLVGETNDAPTLSLGGAQVVRRLAVFVEVARHLAVTAGVAAMSAGKAGGFGSLGRGRTSSQAVGLHLVVLTLPLAELWVLPYKGPEAARGVRSDEASPHLLLSLGMLPPLMFIAKPLLSHEKLEALDVGVLTIELIRPPPTGPESDYVCVHTIVPQPLQGPIEGTVHHMHLGQEGQIFFVIGRRGASPFHR